MLAGAAAWLTAIIAQLRMNGNNNIMMLQQQQQQQSQPVSALRGGGMMGSSPGHRIGGLKIASPSEALTVIIAVLHQNKRLYLYAPGLLNARVSNDNQVTNTEGAVAEHPTPGYIVPVEASADDVEPLTTEIKGFEKLYAHVADTTASLALGYASLRIGGKTPALLATLVTQAGALSVVSAATTSCLSAGATTADIGSSGTTSVRGDLTDDATWALFSWLTNIGAATALAWSMRVSALWVLATLAFWARRRSRSRTNGASGLLNTPPTAAGTPVAAAAATHAMPPAGTPPAAATLPTAAAPVAAAPTALATTASPTASPTACTVSTAPTVSTTSVAATTTPNIAARPVTLTPGPPEPASAGRNDNPNANAAPSTADAAAAAAAAAAAGTTAASTQPEPPRRVGRRRSLLQRVVPFCNCIASNMDEAAFNPAAAPVASVDSTHASAMSPAPSPGSPTSASDGPAVPVPNPTTAPEAPAGAATGSAQPEPPRRVGRGLKLLSELCLCSLRALSLCNRIASNLAEASSSINEAASRLREGLSDVAVVLGGMVVP